MRRIVILVLAALAAWTAWKQYPTLMARRPQHDAVIENATDGPLLSVRLHIGNQTFVKERIEPGESVEFHFGVREDEPLSLEWKLPDGAEPSWNQGEVAAGPMLQRHLIRIEAGQRVVYEKQAKQTESEP